MINKWKTSISCFVILITIGFIYFFAPSQNDITGINAVLITLISAFILTILFSFSLVKAEKKILEKKYRIGWIIKFNAILTVITYISLVILSLISVIISIKYFGAENEMGILVGLAIFYGLLIATPITILFSILPSIFLFGLHKKPRIIKWLGLSLLLLLLAIIAIGIQFVLTCGNNQHYACVAKRAIKKNDYTECEKVKNGFRKGLCYYTIAKEVNDVSLCNQLSDESMHLKCTNEIK